MANKKYTHYPVPESVKVSKGARETVGQRTRFYIIHHLSAYRVKTTNLMGKYLHRGELLLIHDQKGPRAWNTIINAHLFSEC